MPMLVAPIAGLLSDRIGSRPLMVAGLALQAIAMGVARRRRRRPRSRTRASSGRSSSPAPAWRSCSRRRRTPCSRASARRRPARRRARRTRSASSAASWASRCWRRCSARTARTRRRRRSATASCRRCRSAAAVLALGAVIALFVPGKPRVAAGRRNGAAPAEADGGRGAGRRVARDRLRTWTPGESALTRTPRGCWDGSMAERDPFGRLPDENPLAGLGSLSDNSQSQAAEPVVARPTTPGRAASRRLPRLPVRVPPRRRQAGATATATAQPRALRESRARPVARPGDPPGGGHEPAPAASRSCSRPAWWDASSGSSSCSSSSGSSRASGDGRQRGAGTRATASVLQVNDLRATSRRRRQAKPAASPKANVEEPSTPRRAELAIAARAQQLPLARWPSWRTAASGTCAHCRSAPSASTPSCSRTAAACARCRSSSTSRGSRLRDERLRVRSPRDHPVLADQHRRARRGSRAAQPGACRSRSARSTTSC